VSCVSFVPGVILCDFLLCLIVLPLSPGKKPFVFQKNNNNNNKILLQVADNVIDMLRHRKTKGKSKRYVT
jgi:hypothetical protein